jgi:tetratricopeptide (TPR) repeat protein
MKFSNNYIFYPDNSELVKAVDHYKSLSGDQNALDDTLDNDVSVQDNFIHTRGNYEQHRFNTNILEAARETLESTLTESSREQTPLEWAALQNSLGNILAAVGQQRMDVGLFEKAITSFNCALEEFSQENTPSDWAIAQYNLGTATQALGRQLSDSKLLKTSVDAYTNALLVWTREQMPLEWATTMYQLGASFHHYGKLLKGNRTFQKSVVAFKNALAGFDADNHALELAATHNSRGAVLHNLAESEDNAERLEEAIRSYETALTVCMEQQLPFHLAVLCRVNKSTAKAVLAALTKDTVLAEEAADDFELIVECFPHALQPLCLKHCEEQLTKAQSMIETFSGNDGEASSAQ